MADNIVITVAREYGSGGRTVARMIADMLGFHYYDSEILRLASDESGINEALFAKADETVKRSIFDKLANKKFKDKWASPESSKFTSNDNLFKFQSKIIEQLATKGNCVIVGRCADYVLRDRKNVIKVFVHAPLEDKIDRILDLSPLSEDEAKNQIKEIDKHRAEYYEYYTGNKWDCAANYDICINTGKLSFDECCELIMNYIKIRAEI